jgi:hypothetical protein
MKKILALALLFFSAVAAADTRPSMTRDIQFKPGTDTSFTPTTGDMLYWDTTANFGLGGWKRIARGTDGQCMIMGVSLTHVPGWDTCGG